MKCPSSDIARRAFDAVADIQNVASITDLEKIVALNCRALGFGHYVAFDTVDVDGRAHIRQLFGKTHEAWQGHYLERGYQRHDAAIRVTLEHDAPHFWSELPTIAELTKKESLVLHEAAEFGLKDGFVTPLYNLDGSISAVVLSGDTIDPKDPDVRAAAHLISVCFAATARRLLAEEKRQHKPPVSLRPQQLECLRWVREGKSSSDIGQILNLSARTVDEHIARACSALGVRTRVQAVAEAALRGLIQL